VSVENNSPRSHHDRWAVASRRALTLRGKPNN